MSSIFPGKYTAVSDEPFVVFLIGMRINRPLALRKWLPVFNAMPRMLQVLQTYPEKGYLGGSFYVALPRFSPLLVSYWRSFEQLEHFARSQDDPHLGAWRQFNQSIGSDGTVGIWHETYLIDPGKHETVYTNMPRTGLAQALTHVSLSARRETSRQRLNASSEGLAAD